MLTLKCQNFNFGNFAKSDFFCKSYILTNAKYRDLGSLLLILGIKGNIYESSKIADILQEIASHEYFRQKEKKINISRKFEFVLNKINQAFAALAESGHVEWVNKLNLAFAAISDSQIQFTYTGDIKILLFRNGILLNLICDLKNTAQSPVKVFSNIISGTLRKNDKLIFATSEFFNYFSEDSLKKIIQNSFDEACTKLQNTFLHQKENIFPVSLIFAEILDKNAVKSSKPKPLKLKSLYPNLAELNDLEASSKRLSYDHKLKNNLTVWLNQAKNYLVKALATIKIIFNKIFSKFKTKKQKEIKKNASFLQSQKEKTFTSLNLNQLKTKFTPFLKTLAGKFNKLPKTSKLFFITSCIFALAFVISIARQADIQKETKRDSQFDQLFKEASEKEKMASDALIYQDFDKAKNLLMEAKSILEKDIIQSNKEKSKDVDSLLSKINEQFDKIDKKIFVKEPILLAESSTKIENLLGLDDVIYSYDSETNVIYQLEEKTKKLGTIFSESKNVGYFKKAAVNSTKKSLLFLTDTPEIVEFDLSTKELENLDITFENGNNVKEIAIYNDRLYTLDTNTNQIFKHTRTISGYSKGIEWMKESDIDLKNVISFAIDGEIYTLSQDGNVQKFLNGKKEDFKLAELSLPLSSPTKIFTLAEQQFIYILDPKNNRLVVFEKKSGELKNQYISDVFTDLKDIYVNEEAGKIYLLCGQKIFGITLEK